MPSESYTYKDLGRLRELMTKYFSDSELRDLCFDFQVDYETLSGEGKSDKARELVAYAQRHEMLGELVAVVQRLRPDVVLGDIFRFEDEWTRLSANLDSISPQEFERQIELVVHNLVDKLSVSLVSKMHQQHVYAFVVDSSSIFPDFNPLAFLPVLFLRHRQLCERDLEDIRSILSSRSPASCNVAVLILFSEQQSLQEARRLLGKKIRLTYAYDILCLGEDDFKLVVGARDPRETFQRMVLKQIDLATVSPFVTTGPASQNTFFGREKELREVTEHARTASYAIIGGRRMGKTSILVRLHHVRLPAAGFCTLYHDCSATPTYDTFLASAIHDWQPKPPKDNISTFGDLLQFPPANKPLVLLLDEADKLVPVDRANGWRLFNKLRALANSGHAQIVFSGERTLREALRDGAGPLFNFANEKLIGCLEFKAVEELVTRPMKQLDIELVNETTLVSRIYDFTSGHPNVVQRLCRRLIERLNEQGIRRIKLDDVNAVIEDPSFQRDDFLGTFWEASTSLERILSLLMTDDKNVRTLNTARQALVHRCNLNPKIREIDDALQRLVDLRSILKRTPTGYEFAVAAFPRVVAGTMTSSDMLEILAEEYREQNQ